MEEWGISDMEKDLPFTTPLPGDDILGHVPSDAKILDIACGYGRVLRHFHERSYGNLTGNDISKALIAKAMENIPTADFFVGDMTKFTSDKRFNLVLLMGAIEYILGDEEQKEFIGLISGLLEDGGYLYFEGFMLDNIVFLKQYLSGFLHNLHWGRFTNSKEYECHHSSIATLRRYILEEFEIVTETRRKITTWSGKSVNGYSVLAKKKH
jgi:predicted TPR repeat methyltransferase